MPDIKNTHNTHTSNPNPKNKKNKQLDLTAPEPLSLVSHAQRHETQQMRNALCEAIDENEVLRERVMQLQALLAQAQERIEVIEEKYLTEMNNLQRMVGVGDRQRPQRKE